MALLNFAPNIYIQEYPIKYAGCHFHSRMTIIKLSTGQLWIHSPCDITPQLKSEIEALGPVGVIIAPGNYHRLHVHSCQNAFPSAQTIICPGVEKKQPKLKYDAILHETKPEEAYAADLEQVLLQGNRVINEVAFLHKESKTLILTDSIELIGDSTPGTNWVLRFWWKYLLRMWNVPKPAPEYQMGWNNKALAKKSMERIMQWDFEQVIISHGDNITEDAKNVVHRAWKSILG
eukprot:scaffold5322_cov139-Skeletonema_dohrnii-CCMP3373.AAC.5